MPTELSEDLRGATILKDFVPIFLCGNVRKLMLFKEERSWGSWLVAIVRANHNSCTSPAGQFLNQFSEES